MNSIQFYLLLELLLLFNLNVQSSPSSFRKRQVSLQNDSSEPPSSYDINFDNLESDKLIDFIRSIGSDGSSRQRELLSYDGWYHDVSWPDLGSKGLPLKKLAPIDNLPPSNASTVDVFMLSRSIFLNNEFHHSLNGKNLLSIYFGMFLLNDILDSNQPRCPPSYRRVRLPEVFLNKNGDEVEYRSATPHKYILLNKVQQCSMPENSLDKPPRKVNLRSVWLDGEILYGDSKFCSDLLRTFQDGKLIDFSQNNHVNYHHLFNGECFNYFGHNPMNENPFLLSIHFIWIRLHNLLAETISSNDPGMSDQLVYNEARRFTIALYQHVAFNEWIPSFLGENLPRYQRYEPSLDPQIGDLFETLANVYIYSLISPITFRLSTECSKNFRYSLLRTCNTYFDPFHHIRSRNGLEKLWTGLLLQSAQRDDHFIVEDVLTYSKGPLDFTRQDIIALLIQQSRDYQIPDYLTVRKSLGFDSKNKSYESFQQLSKFLWLFSRTVDPKVIGKMEKLYQNNINQIDLIVGALLENSGKEPSPMIKYLFLEQFRRIRDSDRFYFENDQNGQFSLEQIQMIKGIKFSDILGSVARITNKLIQPDAFLLPNDGQNPISPECFESLRKSSRFHSCQTIRESAHCFTLAYLKSFASLEKCTNGTTYDYFSGSEISFFLTIVIIPLFVVLLVILLRLLVNIKNQRNECLRIKVSKLRRMTIGDDCTLVQEWIGPNEGYRNTLVELNSKTKAIIVKLQYENRVVRCIYLKGVIDKVHVEISSNHCQNHLLIRVPKEYDLVLKFDSYYDRENFLTKLEAFLADHRFAMERTSKEIKQIFKSAFTKAKRQKQLEKFFRVVFSQAFNKKTDIESSIDIKTAKEIIETELTQFEFAEVLSMRPESTFVQQMFSLIDKDNNGYISFREFLDVIIIFAKGSAEQKIKIMFDMYDVNQAGRLSIDDFKTMIKSLLEIANQSVSPVEMNQTIHSMLSENGFTSKKELTFEDFSKLFHNYKEELGYTELNFDRKFHDMILIIKFVYWGRLMFLAVSNSDQIPLNKTSRRHSKIVRANETIVRAYSYFGGTTGTDFTKLPTPTFLKIETTEHRTEPDMFVSWIRFLDAKKKEIFFMALYNLIVVIIFLDKSYYYTYLNEASGLRQIVGYGVSLTRGSASVMMFTYSTILLTMCRNLITVFRETFLHQYIPFDGAVTFHKYIAFLALSMTILHSVGHISNFYHISTQRPSDLNCILSETYFNHDELPKFYNWSFGTLTGLTGFGLLFLILIIYIFAIPYSRHHIYNAFWTTHSLYPLFYGLMVLHGLGRLVQPPIFYFYFVIPLTLFTIDRLISASRKKIEISVVKATLHPSNVTHLEFKKPPNFDYKSGQWLRIACLGLNRNEYHPFTIASAPNESTLSLYIRAVGPFTKNIRQIYDHNLLNGRPYPKLFLDGPYGEGHQDWFRYDVSVLVGGGIGITPFASIIKDITFRSSINAKINCKRVYFLWVTRTQKHFEWMSDVIREAEEKDIKNLLVTHIFITQFYEKFDLRTTMLYICERHFQRISNKSLFTGLKAKTHFGRPNFRIFFESLQLEHRNVERVGVFSCGPNPMTNSVQQACDELNRKEGAIFKHHFENF